MQEGEDMIFERLKELRNYEGYTQKDVASILNVQRATYAGWESGKDIMPLSQLLKIENENNLLSKKFRLYYRII